VRCGAAVLVEPGQHVRDVFGRIVQRTPLDENAIDVADQGAAVVPGRLEEQRIVQLAKILDCVDRPTTLVIGALPKVA
jgi:hypothetical protein